MKTEILGCKLDKLSRENLLAQIQGLVEAGRLDKRSFYVVKPNPEIITHAQKDQKLKEIISNSDISVPDGVGLVAASRLLGISGLERLGNAGLMESILQLAAKANYSVYFYGGSTEVVKKLVTALKKKMPSLRIAGYQNGFSSDNKSVAKTIKQANPDILFVALGFPKQEKWIYTHYIDIGAPLTIAEGGSFDFLSGEIKRAPVWVQKLGLEWLFRLMSQPWRIKRQLALIKFVYFVMLEKFKLRSF